MDDDRAVFHSSAQTPSNKLIGLLNEIDPWIQMKFGFVIYNYIWNECEYKLVSSRLMGLTW